VSIQESHDESLGVGSQIQTGHIVDVPFGLVADVLVLPARQHGLDSTRAIDLRAQGRLKVARNLVGGVERGAVTWMPAAHYAHNRNYEQLQDLLMNI
jgi:hypothetical protein